MLDSTMAFNVSLGTLLSMSRIVGLLFSYIKAQPPLPFLILRVALPCHLEILQSHNLLITIIQKAFLANSIMTNKHNSPDELAEAADLYDSPGVKKSEGDAPALVNLPKRRMSGGESQDKQGPSEKKPKFAGPSIIVASTAHEDKNTQK